MPPKLGIAGVGGIVQSDIITPALIDVADSFDDRVVYMPGHVPDLSLEPDGVADYNGRFANAPFLFGGARLLLEGGAAADRVEHVSMLGRVTVLELARGRGDGEMEELLLELGAGS